MPPIVSTDWRRCIFPPNQLFLYFTTTKVIEKASNYKVLFNNVYRLAAAPLNCCKLRATRLASGIFSAVSCCVGFFSNLVLHRQLKQRLTDRRVISAVCEPLFYMYEHSLHLSRRGDASPPLVFAFLLAPNARPNATTKRKL